MNSPGVMGGDIDNEGTNVLGSAVWMLYQNLLGLSELSLELVLWNYGSLDLFLPLIPLQAISGRMWLILLIERTDWLFITPSQWASPAQKGDILKSKTWKQ